MSAWQRLLVTGFACLALGTLPAVAGPAESESPQVQDVPTARVDGPFRVYEQEGWRLEVSTYCGDGSRLIGPPRSSAESAQGEGWRPVHHGSNLEAILTAQPSLREEEAVKTLLQASGAHEAVEPTYSVWHARIVSGALRYETWRGGTRAYLIHTGDDEERLYEGSDLAGILSANANLAALPGMEHLQASLSTFKSLNPRLEVSEDPEAGTPIHLSLVMGPQTVRFAVWTKGADSRWQPTLYSGTDFDALLSAYPSLRGILSRWFMLDTLDEGDEPAQG